MIVQLVLASKNMLSTVGLVNHRNLRNLLFYYQTIIYRFRTKLGEQVEVAKNHRTAEIYRFDNIWHAERINEVSKLISTRARRKNFPYLARWFQSFHFFASQFALLQDLDLSYR